MTLNFYRIQQLATELAALVCLKISTFAIDLILFEIADKEEIHSILDVFEFWLPALEHPKISQLGYNGENGVYSFSWLFTYFRTIQHILVTCWLSGERSSPFGLLVIII